MADKRVVETNGVENRFIGSSSIINLVVSVVMILLGIYVWSNPVTALMALALYLGIVLIIVGGGYLIASFQVESGWYMIVGLINILVGLIFVGNLGVTAETLPIIFGVWALAVGVVQLVTAYQFRSTYTLWYWPLISGIVGILFAYLILTYPAVGSFTITALMGAYIILYGIVGLVEYFQGRRLL